MLKISYRQKDLRAVISWDTSDEGATWLSMARALFSDASSEALIEGGTSLSLPWWTFVGLRPQVGQILSTFNLRSGIDYTIESAAAEFLKQASRNTTSYNEALKGTRLTEKLLIDKLEKEGFGRKLKPEQIRNVSLLASLPAGATFSVPGAGKTTEAFATFVFRRKLGERLLVIAPKNAFAAWDEQLKECLPSEKNGFVRLRGPSISKALLDDPAFMLITYQQLPRVREQIAQHVARHPVHVFLDESHRIKAGPTRQTAQAVLSISQFPVSKLVMSGTPMPQSSEDLLPQFSFLYPEIQASANNVIDLMKPIYVRTNKNELGLPPITFVTKTIPMSPLQLELYQLMKSEVARQAKTFLSDRSKQAFRSLGRTVTRLLQFVSHPALLARELEFARPGLLSAVLAEGQGPKLSYVLHRARQLAREGKKVLIWTSFVHNVEFIADSLQDLGAVFIHGGVDAGDDDDDGTREGKIKLFHDDPNVRVMVANPAAASEGVSLHTICHHAIYLDRSFNAAHFLQSMDRIHRLGLPPDQKTVIEIVECASSIDETVRMRLDFKINQMAVALNDTSLRIDPIPMDPEAIDEDDDWSGGGMDSADVQQLLHDLSLEEL